MKKNDLKLVFNIAVEAVSFIKNAAMSYKNSKSHIGKYGSICFDFCRSSIEIVRMISEHSNHSKTPPAPS